MQAFGSHKWIIINNVWRETVPVKPSDCCELCGSRLFLLSLSPATLSADWRNWEAFILISLYGPNTPIIHLALLTVSTACFPPPGLYFLFIQTFFRPTLDTSGVIKIPSFCFPIGDWRMIDGQTLDLTGCFGAPRRCDFGRSRAQLSVKSR